ncbi:type IV toxin-antitoxin system AbiEi family antitoxin domain-containing protein [Kribbella sancticallisti]|uniref:type IV toxin-antitoxin system AbiEi family antitoxin domain-containing protein n=1 Tax=Kribbella sancticallisti TaxID=460087 RepID=UPI0031DDC6FB
MNPQLSVMTTIRGGVFTRADARACGYPDPDIDSLLDTGGWRRIRRGTYAPHQTLTLVDEEMLHLRRLYDVLRYGEPGLIASHQSAAALHGLPLWGLDLSHLHLTTRTGRAGRRSGGVHRHVRDPVGPGVQLWNKLHLVTPSRAVAEVAATCALAPAVALADAALYAGLVTPSSLKRAANQLPRGTDRAHRVLAHAGTPSASVAESRLRLILTEAGLPSPSASPPPVLTPDEPSPDPSVDLEGCILWFPDERTVIEFDPRIPFWRSDSDDDLEEHSDDDSLDGPDATSPDPLEYCWISWADLDHPSHVIHQVQTAFTRAIRRTGVRVFDPNRPRRKPTTHLLRF